MQCSLTAIMLTLMHLTGTAMFVGAGWMALDETLSLLKQYGPQEGNGNPAVDPPPEYWINPQSHQWELINQRLRGNLVPQVFKGIQYYLIALIVFMLINSLVFMMDAVRSKKAVDDRHYQGKRTGLQRISCTGWLTGYAVFLALMWFVMAGFVVIPILMWRITMQRCWDLASPLWSPGTSQFICVDLVQYGMVFFKEVPMNNGYGMICGPGGNYQPKRGDLEGLCENYYPNFILYLVALIGASIAMFTMVFFALRSASNFVYLKVRRFERPMPPGHPQQQFRPGRGPPSHFGNSMPNPNYEHNVLLVDPNHVPGDVDLDPFDRKSPVGEAMEMKARHYDERNSYYDDRANGDYRRHPDSRKLSESTYGPESTVPPYDVDDKKRRRAREDERSRHSGASADDRKPIIHSDSDRDSRRHHASSRRHNTRHHSSDESLARDEMRSNASYRPKPSKRRTRGAQSESDLTRGSRRSKSRRSTARDEYESPPSDYYIQEDLERRQSRRHMSRSIM